MNLFKGFIVLFIAPVFLLAILISGQLTGEESPTKAVIGSSSNALSSLRLVSPDGVDAGDCIVDPCKTITKAHSRARTGDTILVLAGTYTESIISIYKDVEISGVGVNKTIIQSEPVFDPAGLNEAIFLVGDDEDVTISHMTIRHGGGIVNAGKLSLVSVRITKHSDQYYGSGIRNRGTMTITHSTIDNNGVDDTSSSAIYNANRFESAKLTMINSTVSGNVASHGAGIWVGGRSVVKIFNSTFWGNRATLGGAVWINSSEPTYFTMKNSIITNSLNGDCEGAFNTTFSGGNNLFDDYATTPCSGLSNARALNVESRLKDNGGFHRAPTHALLPGSNAIDNGQNDCAADGIPLQIDQRGLYRHKDGNGDGLAICDIGAYELGQPDNNGPIDLVALSLEVTQGIQDLVNSVRLVANKPAFVRFHVWSRSGAHATTASLRVINSSNGRRATLAPINPIGPTIAVTDNPDRADVNQSFLFQLPYNLLQGEVSLTAVVNPDGLNPIEDDYSNNTYVEESVTFEEVPNLWLVFYRYSYDVNGIRYDTDQFHVNQMVDWVERAFPTPSVSWESRTLLFESPTGQGVPSCETVNGQMRTAKYLDIVNDAPVPFGSHYVGMVQDDGGFMRGCAGRPGAVAATPTGTNDWGWDFDGSYGDWYGGHELAHSYNRPHANFCGATGGGAYPYAGGDISPSDNGIQAKFGFDIGTLEVYQPTWKDVMTYCDNQWISDFTYHKLMDWFQNNPVTFADPSNGVAVEKADRLLIMGFIDAQTGKVSMNNMFVLPGVPDILPRTPGPLSIILLDGDGQELADYPFTPEVIEGGKMGPGPINLPDRDISGLSIREAVPFINGTETVEIRGPYNTLLFSLTPGPAKPTVQILSPNGGEILASENVTLTWSAEDPDGDPMRYVVQYSGDNGARWQVVAQGLSTTTIVLDAANVPATDQGLFRVWATDGLHTGRDVSDGPFEVPNRLPMGAIIRPSEFITVAISQTVNFRGEAYDRDSGRLLGSQLTWTSDIDGELGNGNRLAIASLTPGSHAITFEADDGDGGVVSDTVQVTVIADPAQLPDQVDKLLVAPGRIAFEPQAGLVSDRLHIYNQNQANVVVSWTATVDQPWLQLERSSGMTPDSIAVTYSDDLLAVGLYTGTITISSPDLPGIVTEVPVTLQIGPYNLYMPFLGR